MCAMDAYQGVRDGLIGVGSTRFQSDVLYADVFALVLGP